MSTQKPVAITAVYLKTIGDRAIVEVEIDGAWVEVINNHYDGDNIISHIVEANGIRRALAERGPV